MNRFQTATLAILLIFLGTADASALGRRRRSQHGAPLPSPPMAEPSQPSKLQRMHTLRVEAAQEQYELVKERYQFGALRSDDLFKAQKLLLEASYEAATTPESRLLALERGVKLATDDLKQVTGRVEFGAASQLDRIGAIYALQTAEIRLEEERERQSGRTPSR